MATRVYKEEFIQLQDDTEVRLRPLPISSLRRFQAAWKGFEKLEDEDDGLDILINCSGICLEKDFLKKFDNLRATESQSAKGEFLSPEYKAYLESVLELDTIYKIIEICGGIKLNFDPKAMEEAARLAEEVGKN